jgi:hypothetical protein
MNKPVCRILEDGTQEWRLPNNGHLHRTDGPAYVWPDGTQEWLLNGYRHRTDGPAFIGADGYQQWFIEDQELTEQEVELYRFRKWAVEGELV